MQMTTREAVEISIKQLAYSYTIGQHEPYFSAAKLLCEQYGFRVGDYFNVKETP